MSVRIATDCTVYVGVSSSRSQSHPSPASLWTALPVLQQQRVSSAATPWPGLFSSALSQFLGQASVAIGDILISGSQTHRLPQGMM